MTESPSGGFPRAVVRRGVWPGLVWAIPLAALVLIAWIGLRALTHPGVIVRLDVENAQGIVTGDTHVTYNGLEVGKVTHIALAPRPGLIRLTLKIDASARDFLRTGTRFWVVGSNASLTDLSSLRATISGPSIGMVPGSGAPARQFTAIDRGPVLPPVTPGARFHLVAKDVVSIEPGTVVYTHGWKVGVIYDVADLGGKGFSLEAFIRAPFDRLVQRSTRFWDASALQLTQDAGGLEARLTSPAIALGGGISFDTPAQALDTGRAQPGSTFTLFSSSGEAATAPLGSEVLYRIALDGPAGELQPGAPVRMRGFTVGRVIGVELGFDPGAGVLTTPVTIAFDPVRLHVAGTRAAVDALIERLIAHGYRASLGQSPALIGSRLILFDVAAGAAPARLQPGSPYPWLPSTASGDIGDITAKADSLLTKLNAVPLGDIGQNLREMTANLKSLTGSPKLKDSLTHLDDTLATLDRTTKATAPKIGPLVEALRRTADDADATVAAAGKLVGAGGGGQNGDLPSAIRQLDEAARSIRSLADYLSRHPEAVLKGKREK